MIPSILFNRRQGGHRYIAASAAEYVELFGYPPPILPLGESRTDAGEVIQVVMPAELDTLAGRYLEQLKMTLLHSDSPRTPAVIDQEPEKEYARYLGALIRHVARSDRRLGLLNLFWLAHGKGLRDQLLACFSPELKNEKVKFRVWPMLSGFLLRVQKGVFSGLEPAERRGIGFNLGRDANWGLADALLEEQFALTEADVREFDPRAVLGAHNAHFRMEGDAFAAVLGLVEERFRDDAEKGDRAVMTVLRRRLTGFSSHDDSSGGARASVSSPYHRRILGWYLRSGECAAAAAADKSVRYLSERLGGWDCFAEEFERVLTALQRTEYLQFFQESVVRIPPGFSDSEIKEMFLEGRLYKYSPNLPVVNNFKRVVILFADIREFTRTSEMAISERELTERLYGAFDPLVHIVNTLGGTVDKFTGDGMMITFGAVRSLTVSALRALRCAIAVQEAASRLRAGGRTSFQMGLSIHSGRVFVANFMHDDQSMETTVIGRQVNLAARLSSTRSLGVEGDEAEEKEADGEFTRRRESLRTTPASSPGAVFIDREGNFYNVGVAASQEFIQELKGTVEMRHFSEGKRRGYLFYDRYLKSEVVLHYAGDARFKGFREAVPVYGISWRRGGGPAERPAPPPSRGGEDAARG